MLVVVVYLRLRRMPRSGCRWAFLRVVKIVKEKGLTIKRDAVLIGPCRARQLKRVFFF